MIVAVAVIDRMIHHVVMVMRCVAARNAACDRVEIAPSGVVAVTLGIDLLIEHFEHLTRALDAADFMGDEEIDSMVAESSEEYNAGGVTEEMLRNAFADKLAGLELVEKMQGVTMAGPHRDDLALCASGYEMRSVGSQGQCRSAAIAMRFAAVDIASQHVGKPILLLDDIFAELDVNRRDAVASLVREKNCQVLIATPQVEELPFKADKEISLST